MLRLLGRGGIGLALRRAHAEGAMRHHHQHRPAAAVVQAIGEHLAGTEQAVVADQVDALAQLHAGRVGRRGDAQHLGQAFAGDAQAIAVAERDQAFVAQPAHALAADDLDPMAGAGDRAGMPAHRLGAAQQALRGVEIALLGRGFGATDQAAFDRGDPLHRPRLPRLQLQCGAEREQRAFVVALRQQCLAAGIALPGLFAMIDALQVGRDPGILRPQFAQHRTTP